MTASVDQVLRDHGLTRENAKQFVLLSPAFNRKALADEMEISEDTAHRYRRAFREMDVADRARVVAALAAERQVRDEGGMTQDERDTGTFLDEVPTDAYMGEVRNDDGRLVSVLRWHFEADDIEQNKHPLIQRDMAAYAIARELKNVSDLLLEVADQPDVKTYKEHVRGALNQRIKEIEGDSE